MIPGIKTKAPSCLEDWNSGITMALDKLFLQGVAGMVPYYHCPQALATLTHQSQGGKHTKPPHVIFLRSHFFALSKYFFYCNFPWALWLVRVIQVSSHHPWWQQTWQQKDEDGSSHSAQPALSAPAHVSQQLSCSWSWHGALAHSTP